MSTLCLYIARHMPPFKKCSCHLQRDTRPPRACGGAPTHQTAHDKLQQDQSPGRAGNRHKRQHQLNALTFGKRFQSIFVLLFVPFGCACLCQKPQVPIFLGITQNPSGHIVPSLFCLSFSWGFPRDPSGQNLPSLFSLLFLCFSCFPLFLAIFKGLNLSLTLFRRFPRGGGPTRTSKQEKEERGKKEKKEKREKRGKRGKKGKKRKNKIK